MGAKDSREGSMTQRMVHDLVILHYFHGRIPDDMQDRHIFAIGSSNATESRKLARTVRCHQGTDAIADASVAVRSVCSIQLVGIALPLKTSFGDEIEKCKLII